MKKVLFGFMAIMMCVGVFSACSSKTKVVKDAVEKAKKDGGIPKTENGVTIADIRFDEVTNTIDYVCELPVEFFQQLQITAAQDNYKDVLIYSKKDDLSLKALAELLIDIKGNLKFTYKPKGDGTPIELSYDVDVLRKLVNGTLPEAQLQPVQEQTYEVSESAQGEDTETEEGVDEE
ncbi:hypothetical protein [Bacteroides heparinolyticus]|uniref:hypothetical protein n=2 Tax=Prevotella heparinolytica TaxID=28113 RepID=UPI00359FE478